MYVLNAEKQDVLVNPATDSESSIISSIYSILSMSSYDSDDFEEDSDYDDIYDIYSIWTPVLQIGVPEPGRTSLGVFGSIAIRGQWIGCLER